MAEIGIIDVSSTGRIENGIFQGEIIPQYSEEYLKLVKERNERKKEKEEEERMQIIDAHNAIDIAIKLFKEGIISKDKSIFKCIEAQYITSDKSIRAKDLTIDEILIQYGYKSSTEREEICKKIGIYGKRRIGSSLAFALQEYKKGQKSSKKEIFDVYKDKKYELAEIGIIDNISATGEIRTGLYAGNVISKYREKYVQEAERTRQQAKQERKRKNEEEEEIYRLQAIKNAQEEKKKREETERKKQEEERIKKQKNSEGFNIYGEYEYKGKMYKYNPLTGKKADGTYDINLRDERGFNPDGTWKDTGKYFNEEGINKWNINREGVNTQTGEKDSDIKKVIKFIESGQNKREYCGKDGKKIQELNKAIDIVMKKFPQLQPQINEANSRIAKPKSSLELKNEILKDRETYKQMKESGKYSKMTLNNMAKSINEKILKYNERKAQETKEATEQLRESKANRDEAQKKNVETRKLESQVVQEYENKKGKSYAE